MPSKSGAISLSLFTLPSQYLVVLNSTGIKLCACLIRGLFEIVFLKRRYDSVRSYYLLTILIFAQSGGFQALIQCQQSYVILTFVCVTYCSLFIHSSLSLVSLCYILFHTPSFIISVCNLNWMQIQSVKTDLFLNAYILSSKLAAGIQQGLNVIHLINLANAKMSHMNRCVLLAGSSVIINGRIISGSNMKTKMNGLCVSTLNLYQIAIILDYGYIQCVSNLGEIGVKVGILY